MGTAIVELNDSAILCRHDHLSLSVPGYALLTKKGVITGVEAARKAWLLPQQSNSHFWYQLNLSPLSAANHHARHHADLAYAQLLALYNDAGKPDKFIFAVPGNVTNDQLSILLGLIKASPFKAAGLVDAAVAATSQTAITGDVVHIDLQLHSCVFTRLKCSDTVSRQSTSQYPGASLKGFFDTWAHFIANRFIDEYRYDPLHTAQGEQQLRDLLPEWLRRLKTTPEIEIELSAKQGNFRLNILRSELIAANSERWQRLAHAVAQENPTDTLLVSHRIDDLPGATDYLEYTQVLPPQAVIEACLAHLKHIEKDGESQVFITSLPALLRGPVASASKIDSEYRADIGPDIDTDIDAMPSQGAVPSHVLYRHRAYAIDRQLRIARAEDGLVFSHPDLMAREMSQDGNKEHVLLSYEAGRLNISAGHSFLVPCSAGNSEDLRIGDEISIAGEVVKLIKVQ